MSEAREPWKLYFDGTCNLCFQSSKKVQKWAQAAGQPLEVHTLQSSRAKQKGYSDQMVLEAERTYFAAEAWLRVMAIAPWYVRWVSWLRFTPITKWVAATGYNFVARNRHLWMGKRQGCDTGG